MKLKTLNPIKLILKGEDKFEFLQSIITNDIYSNKSNLYSYILTPLGKILYEIQFFFKIDLIEIVCTNVQADLFVFFNKFAKLSEVSIEKTYIENTNYNLEYFTDNLKKGRIDINFITHSTLIPSEVHENYIDYKKGCFVGQEVASRIKHRNLKKKIVTIFVKRKDYKPLRFDNFQVILDFNEFILLRIPISEDLSEFERIYNLRNIQKFRSVFE